MPLSITKPTVGGSADSWGTELNAALDAVKAFVDGLETSRAALASPAFTGNPTAPTPTAGDNDTSVATTAFVASAVSAARGAYVGINAQTGTTYTPVLADQGKLVTLTNAAAITVSLPQNSSVAFPVGATIDFVVLGAGMATFAAGAGATKVPAASVTRAQYSVVSAVKIATNDWLVVGDLAA